MFRAVILTLSSFMLSGGGASGCCVDQSAAPPAQKPGNTITQKPGSTTAVSDLKILAEGFHSSVQKAFVAVARDAETYRALRELEPNLPGLDEDFFTSNMVVAAFLGVRNTGGYSVQITRDANGGIRITEKTPGKDTMVSQMITSPFKVLAVSVKANAPLPVALDNAWRQKTRTYKVTAGKFTMFGGFIGLREEFGLEGKLSVMHEGKLASLGLALNGTGKSRERSLTDFGTGVVQSDHTFTIDRLGTGSLIDPPSSGMQTTGMFSDGEKKISIRFSSLPSRIADGYNGQGTIEAEAVDSALKP